MVIGSADGSGDISVGDTLSFLIHGDEYWNGQPDECVG
jgi:hypothetical protein